MKASDWRPIETAPRDGTAIILYRPTHNEVATGRYDRNQHARTPRPYWEDMRPYLGVTWMRDNVPTHWMPLPNPPADLAKERESAQ